MKLVDQKLLRCPSCFHEELDYRPASIICCSCGLQASYQNDRVSFSKLEPDDISDWLDKLKHLFKNSPTLYFWAGYFFGGEYVSFDVKNKFLNKYVDDSHITINLGSGNTDIGKNIINADIFQYPNTDLVCDIAKLPIKSNSIDRVLILCVLEHVPVPEDVVKEIHRILKPGGMVCSIFPFMQGFHASPYDYSRRTGEGVRYLFKEYEVIELSPWGGPSSGFMWVFQEWLAMILSLGFVPLYRFWHFVLMLTTFPLKFLDPIMRKHPMALTIAASIFCIAQKKDDQL